MFGQGDFQAPMLVHDRVPPGVPTLQRLKADMTYRYEELETGARIRIATRNKEALAAVHDFLKFQIADHHSGDPAEIVKDAPSK